MSEWYITPEDLEKIGPFHWSNKLDGTTSEGLKDVMTEQLEAITTYIAGILAPAMPIGHVSKVHPVDEKGDIMIEVEVTPGLFVWKEGEAPKSVAEHFESCTKKARKYPNECPCGIKASDCTYHADL